MTTKLLLLAVTLLVRAEAPQEDAVKEELKKFQGKWKLVSANLDGRKAPEAELKTIRLIVEGDRFTLTNGIETYKGKFTINPSGKPKTIDVEFTEGFKGVKVLGIYQIDGDMRKSCFSDSDTNRPEDFQGGKRRYVWVWQADRP
jgi:uncharacterized protein (TIGR03067 family)